MMTARDKPLVWLHGEVKSPPLSKAGRMELGFLLRMLQRGRLLALPHSRPMPRVGRHCHELRLTDVSGQWRLIYRIDSDAILVLDVFQKKTVSTPLSVISACQSRARIYDDESN